MDENEMSMKLTTTTGGGSTLLTIRLRRDESPDESDEAILREQLDAMTAFADGWLEPLALSLDVVCCDPTQGYSSHEVPLPSTTAWFMRTANAPGVDVQPPTIGSEIIESETIDAPGIRSFVNRALDQRCVGNAVTAAEFLSWEAMRVRLPIASVSQFMIDDGGQLDIPIERRADGDWVSGPRTEAVTGKPFWFHLAEGGLRFDVIWSLWLDGAGRQQVDAAVERVLARGTGWYRRT
jgi:hypothetical protein